MIDGLLLHGWGVGDEVEFATLPLPPYPQPLTLITLSIPGLNAALRALRPDTDTTYPDEYGLLERDEGGGPRRVELLGRTWDVQALIDYGPAMEVDAGLESLAFHRATVAALDVLDSHSCN